MDPKLSTTDYGQYKWKMLSLFVHTANSRMAVLMDLSVETAPSFLLLWRISSLSSSP